ncbi:MAG: prolyl oligopeptidase family serine peptidase, partial [Balneolaceae bacterium]|nr:prolyl oligopeptidase family serine peptidase [Balneolaceae bacterium]
TLNYRISYPDANPSDSYPVVIFLHGAGERGSDNRAQLKWGVQNFVTDKALALYEPIVIAPQCPSSKSWANYERDEQNGQITGLADTPSRPLEMTMEVLEQVLANSNADPDRVYITGLSMGGYGTWDALARWPETFAAGAPVCGGGDPGSVKNMADIPIWAFHGAEDAVVPPERSREMIDALHQIGARPGYTEYPEVGHFSWVHAYSDPLFMNWLFDQEKE